MDLHLADVPSHERRLEGFGLECDAYLYDEVNAAAGVGEEDYALFERRLRAVRPAIARTFCDVDWFNPARDAATYDWTLPGYARLLRLLRLLQGIGTRVNLVLFHPYHGLAAGDYPPLVRAMADLLIRLQDEEGVTNVRWLTIYNEPEMQFPHDSPLMRRLFGDERVDTRPGWEIHADLIRHAQSCLEALGLYPHVRMAVPDCVYGSPVRYERMRLAAGAFAAADVTFAVHVYSPEDQSTQPDNEAHRRDWGYPGMTREASDFRAMVGPDRPMILWEYNLEGRGGHTSCFPGVNQLGLHPLETLDAGPEILEKTILAANHGYDGACLWCLADLCYCGNPGVMMTLGMWRFKNARWYPRPHYYYYSPLCQLFRPGMTPLPVAGAEPPVHAFAARGDKETVAVLLNRDEESRMIAFAIGAPGAARRLRVRPDAFPYDDADLPLDTWEDAPADTDGTLRLELAPREATFLRLEKRR